MRPLNLLALAWLGGCGVVSDDWYTDNVRDVDGDGVIAERFGGKDCDDGNPLITICDADGDGENSIAAGGTDCDDTLPEVNSTASEECDGIDNDCDGLIDDLDDQVVDQSLWHRDADGDSFGSPDDTLYRCDQPAGYVVDNTDCDDNRGDVRPDANEFCDNVDHNCDGDPKLDAVDQVEFYLDDDQDGFGRDALSGLFGCPGEAPAGSSANALDCDDGEATTYPGAPEVWYDGVDQDCAGDADDDQDGDGVAYTVDCDDEDATIRPGAPELCDGIDNDCDDAVDEIEDVAPFDRYYYFRDADGDLEGAGAPVASCDPVAPDGYVSDGGDCDDTNAAIKPGNAEICDGLDNDCNTLVDDNAANMRTFYIDGDGDGFGGVEVQGCTLRDGWVDNNDDCQDGDPTVFPGAYEVCGDSVQQDCSLPGPLFDCDGDGLDGAYAANNYAGQDCEDDSSISEPGAAEICDGIDNDCDGQIDNPPTEPVSLVTYYIDTDGDGFGSAVQVFPATCEEAANYVTNSDDCDDLSGAAYPGAGELCDGIDNNCDGVVDDGLIAVPRVFYLDEDGDGFGDPLVPYAQGCTPPDDGRSWVDLGTDCDDDDPDTRPQAVELCDGVDNDCDGLIDGDDTDSTGVVWFADTDGDGFGAGAPLESCTQPVGYVASDTDCDDTQSAVNPNAAELCDGIDNDCDGRVDGADDQVSSSQLFYPDIDGDGFGDGSATPVQGCSAPALYVADASDCDDAAANISPAAPETCDGIDNDCDGLTDDADAVSGAPIWFLDLDGDTHGDINAPVYGCMPPVNAVADFGDCDDTDINTHPGAAEYCDSIDNDCDGVLDADDPDVRDTVLWFRDADQDNAGDPADSVLQCGQPAGYVSLANDCDDSTAAASPYQVEACDDIDNDCDGLIDDADSVIYGTQDFYLDGDGDGYFGNTTERHCLAPGPDWSASQGQRDCDDADPTVNPAASEICGDGLDNDCDGEVELAFDGDYVGASQYFRDRDGDGEGGTPVTLCPSYAQTQPDVYTSDLDCDDNNALAVSNGPVVIGSAGPTTSLQAALDAACPGGSPTFVLGEPLDESISFRRSDLGTVTLQGGGHTWTAPGTCAQIDAGTWVMEDLTVADCIGAGLMLRGVNLTMVRTDVLRNNGLNGGGVAVGSAAVLDWQQGTLADNEARLWGGGLYVSSTGAATLTDVEILRNSADQGGGVYTETGFAMFGGSLQYNSAITTGGAFVHMSGRLDFEGTDFIGNTSVNRSIGSSAFVFINDSVIQDNNGSTIALYGFQGGSVSNVYVSGNDGQFTTPGLSNAVFEDNTTSAGTLVTATTGNNVRIYGAPTSGITLLSGGDDVQVLGAGGDGITLKCAATYTGLVAADTVGAGIVIDRPHFSCSQFNVPYTVYGTVIGSSQGFDVRDGVSVAHDLRIAFANGANPDFVHDTSFVPQGGCFTDTQDATSSNCGFGRTLDFTRVHPNLDYALWDVSAYIGAGGYDPYNATVGHFHTAGDYILDTDGDGLYDGWELRWLEVDDPTLVDVFADPDGDGLDNETEFAITRTHPNLADTDGDGSNDNVDGSPLDPTVQ